MDDLTNLQAILDYKFNDIKLLKLALTHRSHSRENNERLEFVGDGVLDYVVAMNLYHRYPHLSEGSLSKIRASLVNQNTLVEIATQLGLGKYLFLGPGEERSG
ncbi:MAG TPA: ribonuclease III domain-containing protein, partial [Aquella sp.]|nr:ribonuclease III domain-containing protein [Aquella sp.]